MGVCWRACKLLSLQFLRSLLVSVEILFSPRRLVSFSSEVRGTTCLHLWWDVSFVWYLVCFSWHVSLLFQFLMEPTISSMFLRDFRNFLISPFSQTRLPTYSSVFVSFWKELDFVRLLGLWLQSTRELLTFSVMKYI